MRVLLYDGKTAGLSGANGRAPGQLQNRREPSDLGGADQRADGRRSWQQVYTGDLREYSDLNKIPRGGLTSVLWVLWVCTSGGEQNLMFLKTFKHYICANDCGGGGVKLQGFEDKEVGNGSWSI